MFYPLAPGNISKKKDQEEEVEKKRLNIIIEGLKEVEKENTRQIVIKLLSDIGVSNVNALDVKTISIHCRTLSNK